ALPSRLADGEDLELAKRRFVDRGLRLVPTPPDAWLDGRVLARSEGGHAGEQAGGDAEAAPILVDEVPRRQHRRTRRLAGIEADGEGGLDAGEQGQVAP